MMAPPRDQEARDRALNPQESFHLEAPAGSGKTAVLLARFLTLLAQVGDSPQEILTLTFTRKAAGEFRERAMKYFWSQTEPGADLPPHERLLHELARQSLLASGSEKSGPSVSHGCRSACRSPPSTAFAPNS
jgi:ATP-dependent helicase/nuclease subunit A